MVDAPPDPFAPYPLYVAPGGFTWSPDQTYAPGALVMDATPTLYVANIQSGLPTRVASDGFGRADADNWGCAPVGGCWAAVSDNSLESISGQVGYMAATGMGPTVDTMVLGTSAGVGGTDLDLVVTWAALSSTSGHAAGAVGLGFIVRFNPTGPVMDLMQVTMDGSIAFAGSNSSSDSGTWAGSRVGTKLTTRMRASGTSYLVRTWLAGTTEPKTWDLTSVQSGAAIFNGQVGLQLVALDATDSAAVYSVQASLLPTAPGSDGNVAWDQLVTGAV